MKNKTNHRPSSAVRSIKTVGTNIINHHKTKDSMPGLMLVRDIQGTQGNGLWCVNTDKINKKTTTINNLNLNPSDLKDMKSNTTSNKIFVSNNPNLELELEFEKKKINQLKNQIEELNIKLNTAITKCSDVEFRANRAENNKQTYMQLCEKKSIEIQELTEKLENLENSVINLNEALNNSRKEISRLQTEIQSESEKSKRLSEMYQNSIIENERKHSILNSELNNLNNKLQQVNLEKENFIKFNRNYNNQEKTNEFTNLQKLLDEKESILKLTESQMRTYGNENAELKRKLISEETMKSKLNEIIKKKKAKIEKLKDDLKSYKGAMETYTNEVKWNQDLVLQRDNQIKIFKDKLKIYEDQNEKLKKENQKLKEMKSVSSNGRGGDNENFQEIKKINPRPYLFGPDTDDL
jgi:chromosome segregation ATPase